MSNPRHAALAHLDSGAYSGCPIGTKLVAYQGGVCVGTIPVGAEVFLVDPNTGKVLRRLTGGDNVLTLLGPVL